MMTEKDYYEQQYVQKLHKQIQELEEELAKTKRKLSDIKRLAE